MSSKLIVSKEKDLDSIVKSAIKSSTWHAAIVESFGTGRKNSIKNSLMALNQLSSTFQTPCTILVTNCKQKFCKIRSSSVLSCKNDRGEGEKTKTIGITSFTEGLHDRYDKKL